MTPTFSVVYGGSKDGSGLAPERALGVGLDAAEEPRGAEDGRGAGVGVGAVALLAGDLDLREAVTLVGADGPERGGLAHDGVARGAAPCLEQHLRAETAHLLVGGEDQAERLLHRGARPLGGEQGAGDEGLGVAGAAAVEAVVLPGERQRLGPAGVVGDAVGVADQRELGDLGRGRAVKARRFSFSAPASSG